MGDGIFKWYVGLGEDCEVFHLVDGGRDDAIEVGRNDYHRDGVGFTICEADKSVLGPNFSEDSIAESIMEQLLENNEDCWGEDGPDDPWPDGAQEDLQKRLRATVADWLKAHPAETWRFGTQRHNEFFPAPLRERVLCELERLTVWKPKGALVDHDPNAIAIDLTMGDGAFAGEDVDTIASHVVEWQDAKKEGRDV